MRIMITCRLQSTGLHRHDGSQVPAKTHHLIQSHPRRSHPSGDHPLIGQIHHLSNFGPGKAFNRPLTIWSPHAHPLTSEIGHSLFQAGHQRACSDVDPLPCPMLFTTTPGEHRLFYRRGTNRRQRSRWPVPRGSQERLEDPALL